MSTVLFIMGSTSRGGVLRVKQSCRASTVRNTWKERKVRSSLFVMALLNVCTSLYLVSHKLVVTYTCTQHTTYKPAHAHTHTECCISSLHFSNLTLYFSLTCGKVLILDVHSFNCLCTLSCHRNQVKSLFCIDLALLQQQDLDTFSLYEREKMERLSSSSSTPSVLHSTNPSPIHLSDRSPSLSSIQTVNANSRQLLSFGTGFRSYFDGPESKQYWDSGFLLVWESEHWNGDS